MEQQILHINLKRHYMYGTLLFEDEDGNAMTVNGECYQNMIEHFRNLTLKLC